MIGEIRDQETAQIAVQASITGHLVVRGTLHTQQLGKYLFHDWRTWELKVICLRIR